MRKLPSNVHELKGNPSKRRHSAGIQPEILPTVPPPPSFLDEIASQEWRRISPELCRLGLLSRLDIMPLAAYCWNFGLWSAATKDGAAEGLFSDEGRELARVARDAARDMLAVAKHFGLTPLSRASVGGGSPPDPDKFDGLIGA